MIPYVLKLQCLIKIDTTTGHKDPKSSEQKSRHQKRPLFTKQTLKKDNYKVFDEQYKKSITKRNEKSLVYRLIFLKSV